MITLHVGLLHRNKFTLTVYTIMVVLITCTTFLTPSPLTAFVKSLAEALDGFDCSKLSTY